MAEHAATEKFVGKIGLQHADAVILNGAARIDLHFVQLVADTVERGSVMRTEKKKNKTLKGPLPAPVDALANGLAVECDDPTRHCESIQRLNYLQFKFNATHPSPPSPSFPLHIAATHCDE